RAFACFVRVPMAIQKPIKDQCLHLGMFSLFFRIAIRPIESCTIALGINIRSEENVLAVWRPEFAATFSCNRGQLVDCGDSANTAIEIGDPDLRAAFLR